MHYFKRRVYLPGPIYRALPAIYVLGGIALIFAVDHAGAAVLGAGLLLLAATVSLKRFAAR